MDADAAPKLPSGTVTFLLTDVEGSSRLWEADADAASVALARRLEIISDATLRHGGVLPLEQGEGDSSVSAFARSSDAAMCAVEIQRDLSNEVWPEGAEIRARIALHTGEAELRPDGTYQGAPLNRCARLRSLGHGGQILVSQATYEVLVDGLTGGVGLRDLGMSRLRDLARPEHVWQLCHPDLLHAFPPLHATDTVANNLPVQLTSFVGREAEIDAASATIRQRRLVTLAGAGGSGKTRLALQLATRVADDYPDGLWWVDLAPLADPSLVPAALAALLDVRESPFEPVIDTVARHLAAHRALVVLDNCEHLVDSCATLAARLIQGCSALTVLATSREPLRVEGEAIWPVAPLSVPGTDDDVPLADSEAVRLFVDRARASHPTFSLIPDNASSVAQICTRLDGIPLAIELAAARARMLTVDQIAAGLADRFHLLTGGARTALPRQRTLESSVDWSHDLLGHDERTVFRRLAVFAGSFTLDAAEAICADDAAESNHVLDLLSGLVDRSLVEVAEEAGSRSRYRMLETIRDYARHKLADADQAERTRDRHLDHYVSFAERAAAGLEGADLVDWLAWVDVELDNLRAALDWSPHSTEPERGARVVGLLSLYWFARSEIAVGRARLEGTLGNASGDGPDRASALSALCMVEYRAGDMVAAGRHGDEAIAIARRLDDASLLGRALHWRAWVRYWGDADRATAWTEFEEAADLLAQAKDRVYRPLNLAVFAWACFDTSDALRSTGLLNEGLALTDAAAAPHARCYCHVSLGYLDWMEGRLADAATHLDEALRLANQIGDHYAEICAGMFRTLLDAFRGRYEDGRALAARELAAALVHRTPNGEAFTRLALGFLEYIEGNLDAAASEFELSYAGLGIVMPFIGALCRAGQARVALARGVPSEARQYAADALNLGHQIDSVVAIEFALEVQATLSRDDHDAHAAEDLLHTALDTAHQLGRQPAMCDLLEALGGALADQERFEEAARLMGAADAARERIGYVRFPVRAPLYDADVAVARDGVGPEEFDRAWADGAGLSLDDAVAYARRGRGRRGRPSHGWTSLTPTEIQVVELVSEGLTNPQIGERLLISSRTVQTHVAHVFGKLGMSTRAELAGAATRRRLKGEPFQLLRNGSVRKTSH